MTGIIDLRGWSNAPFPPDILQLCADDAGEVPQPLAGYRFALDVRIAPGAGSALIALDTAADAASNGVRIMNAAAGEIRIQIGAAQMAAAWNAAHAAGLMTAGAPAALVYDLRVTDTGGLASVWLEGRFTIEAGVTT